MFDYNKVCWYCSSKDLKDMGNYVQCRKCGATHNDLPEPGILPVVVDFADEKGEPGRRRMRRYRPHAVLTRQSARAREKAKL